jgi:hypothetical protein
MPTEMSTLKSKGTVHSKEPQVKYGVRAPKFIWAPCAQLYSLAETMVETPHPPPSLPPHFVTPPVLD